MKLVGILIHGDSNKRILTQTIKNVNCFIFELKVLKCLNESKVHIYDYSLRPHKTARNFPFVSKGQLEIHFRRK